MKRKQGTKSIFRRWWFWAILVLLLIGLFGGNGKDDVSANVSRSVELAAVTDTPAPTDTPEPTFTPEPTDTPEPTAEPTPTPERVHGHYADTEVYVSNNGIIHSKPDCSNMKYYTTMTIKEADAAGYEYCGRCF